MEPFKLDKFQLRPYQVPIWDSIFLKGLRRVIAVLPRRAGKDLVGFNMAIFQCLLKPCLVQYVLPVFDQARGTIFDAITIDGDTFLSYLPMPYVEKINIHQMKIIFKNNSILQLVGGEKHKTSIRGRNPFAVILSEYAYFEADDVLDTISPILAANGGWLLILSTPWGKNHFFQLCEYAKNSPDWFYYYQKTSAINHIPSEVLEKEQARMSHEKYLQEYECSFESGVDATYYGRLIERLRQHGQITSVAWDPSLLVHISFDIGVSDATTLIFFQTIGNGTLIRIIDCHSNSGVGLDYYAKYVKDKPYQYGYMFAPHDIQVREWGSGAITRFEKAVSLGLELTLLPQLPIADGIENVMTLFNRLWIDSDKCKSLIDSLENYRKEKDDRGSQSESQPRYKNKPIHNWASHYADSLRYLCQGLSMTYQNSSGQDWSNIRQEGLYGKKNNLPKIFQHDPRYDR